MTAGLQNSELIIVAARPSRRQDGFALNMARHMAVEEKLPVFFVSLEQSRIELAERLLCCQARVDSHKLRKGRPELGRRLDKLDRGRRHPVDKPSSSSTTARARACCASPPTPVG